jgi:hypothetical protein
VTEQLASRSHSAHTPGTSFNGLAFSATVHCLTGCAIGEVLGMVIGTTFGWSNLRAGVAAFPVNRWLLARGKGHAVVHAHHAGHDAH